MLPIQGRGKPPGGPSCPCPRCWHPLAVPKPGLRQFLPQTFSFDILRGDRDRPGAAGVSGEGTSFPSALTKVSPNRVEWEGRDTGKVPSCPLPVGVRVRVEVPQPCSVEQPRPPQRWTEGTGGKHRVVSPFLGEGGMGILGTPGSAGEREHSGKGKPE